MGDPRSQTPASVAGGHGDCSRELLMPSTTQCSPQTFVSSAASSSRSQFPPRKPLPAYLKTSRSLASLIKKKTLPQPITGPTPQSRSIMALRFDRMKDKWQGFRTRTSPAVFRFAGHVFLAIVLLSFAAIIIGWYGLSQETITHDEISTAAPTMATPAPPDYRVSPWIQTPALDVTSDFSPQVLARDDLVTSTTTMNLGITTVAQTIVVTIVTTETLTTEILTTEILTTEPSTTESPTTCTTTLTTPTSRTALGMPTDQNGSVMTGIMYCSFTGRRNIFTLCPHIHTEGPGMLPTAPVPVAVSLSLSSGASPSRNANNPFVTIREAMTSFWTAMDRAYGQAMLEIKARITATLGSKRALWGHVHSKPKAEPGLQPQSKIQEDEKERKEHGKGGGGCSCDCDCQLMREQILEAYALLEQSSDMLGHQYEIMDKHRKGLVHFDAVLANVTALAQNVIGLYERRSWCLYL
ncbi:hypothetical protein F4777DRAFT_532204 [Nemania sp. FL0916]|nr:hypothetical protein F4777DRAFT_532204 [Nemania sp. FL0916]